MIIGNEIFPDMFSLLSPLSESSHRSLSGVCTVRSFLGFPRRPDASHAFQYRESTIEGIGKPQGSLISCEIFV